MRRLVPFLLAAAGLALPATVKAQDAPQRPFLTLDAAQAGVEACLDFARQSELRVAVAVKDRAGRDVAFARMDDVFQKQAEFARIKAESAATTPLSTKQLSEVTQPGSALEGLVQLPGLTRVEGGEPVTLPGGYHLGAVGVSGASPAQDGECARMAGAAIVQRLLGR